MILRRVMHHVRNQEWTAIALAVIALLEPGAKRTEGEQR